MPPGLPSNKAPKENKVRFQMSLSPSHRTGATVQWLKSHDQQEQMLDAILAFWFPFALREQNTDPVWAKSQALSSIDRLRHQILLIQQEFGIPNLEVTSQMSAPVVSASYSAPPHVEPAPIPVQAAIPVVAPALPAPIPVVVPSAPIPVVPLVPLSVPQSQPIPVEDDEFDGYNIQLKGFEDFDAVDAANAAEWAAAEEAAEEAALNA